MFRVDQEITAEELLNLSATPSADFSNLTITTTPEDKIDDPWYTHFSGAGLGFKAGLGGAISGTLAIKALGASHYAVLKTLVGSGVGAAAFTALDIAIISDSEAFTPWDYAKSTLVGVFAVGVTTLTLTSSAAIIEAANVTLSETIGLGVGALFTNMIIVSPAAASLAAFGLFKAREYIQAKNVENDFQAPSFL